MSQCTHCKDAPGPIKVSYWNNDELKYPVSVQVCSPCFKVLKIQGKLDESDIIEGVP